jgi:hypothetical protein
MFKHIGTLTALGLSLALTACGGNSGGGTNGTGSSSGPGDIGLAEGAWSGTNSLGNDFDMLILENGDVYSMYGTLAGGVFSATGFDIGIGSAKVSGSTLTAGFTQYDYLGHRVTGNLTANVVRGTSINGSANGSAGTGTPTTFTSTPLSATYTSYNYNTPAAISDIANGWNGKFLDGSTAVFSIDAAGVLSGTNLGCSFTGTVTPRASGKNVFNVSLHFGASPCTTPNQDASGIALSYITNTHRQFIASVENTDKMHGSMFFALR